MSAIKLHTVTQSLQEKNDPIAAQYPFQRIEMGKLVFGQSRHKNSRKHHKHACGTLRDSPGTLKPGNNVFMVFGSLPFQEQNI